MTLKSRVAALLGCALVLAACAGPSPAAPGLSLTASPGHLSASGPVTLTASVTGGAASVSFYRNGALLGVDTSAPYTWTDAVRVPSAGTIHYRAVAEDRSGHRAEATADVILSLEEIAGTIREGQVQAGADGAASLALTPWTGGVGTFSITAFASGREPLVLSVPLSGDGTFRLALPTPTPDQLQPFDFSGASCANTVTVSDPAARGVSPLTTVEAGKSGLVRPLALLGATEQEIEAESAMLVYVDRLLTLKGTAVCLFQTETYDNLTLQPGWNEVQVAERYVRGVGISYTYSNAAVPDNWVYVDISSDLGSLGLPRLKAPGPRLFR